ncbi:hypothetical protein GGS23DRAFT_593547 [Durotheca rogersii]|uniref:uncharacterized protein n=1 Tax=Durotheca rogersii TaxID=419775 RepID=UPI00221F16A5|nr:uncharacterized protein GGS23DRAFT_593547 [Durotheca rogersii]KAI5866813.1 hypothetical protein GGS23DRAFT_593547 [Durotheca rogersii]
MSRTIYLLVFNQRPFKAHWCLWIPGEDNPNVGKRIHVEGSVSEGFRTTITHNYDISRTSRRYQLIALGQVSSRHIVDPNASLGQYDRAENDTPTDKVESVASAIPAPGPSLVSASSSQRHGRIQLNDCQTWLTQVISALVNEGILNDEAINIIQSAPEH